MIEKALVISNSSEKQENNGEYNEENDSNIYDLSAEIMHTES